MAEGTWTQTFPSLVEHTKATGGSINTRFEGLGSNYDLLPAPHDDGRKGFFGPCYVGAATELGHAGSVADIRNGAITHGTESGAADAYVVTMAIPATAYTAGMKINFVAGNTNTGVSTINLDGLGVTPLKLSTSIELSANYIYAGDIVEAVFTGTYFQITSISGNTADAAVSAAAAAVSAAAALISEAAAADSETVCLASSNFIGAWADQTGAHVVPTSVSHDSKYWLLVSNVADITLSEPGVTADWGAIGGGGGGLTWAVATTPVTAADANGYIMDATLATQVINLPAGTEGMTIAAQYLTEFDVAQDYFINFVPDGTENIEGANTTLVVDAKSMTLVYSDVTNGWKKTAKFPLDSSNYEHAPMMHVQDRKTLGVSAGTPTLGDNTRELSTVVTNEITGASLSSNQITLAAGSYDVVARAPALIASAAFVKLVIEDSSGNILLEGMSSVNSLSSACWSPSVEGRLNLATETTILVNQKWSGTISTDALGEANNLGTYEAYTEIFIRQLDAIKISPIIHDNKLYPVAGQGYVTGNMYGLEYSYTSANTITVEAGVCMDSLNTTALSASSSQVVTIGTTINTIYNLFLCDDGVVRADTDVDGATLLAGAVTALRWIGFVRTNSTGGVCRFTLRDNLIVFLHRDECLTSTVTTTYATVDLSAFIPESRITGILFGVRHTAADSQYIMMTDDGVDVTGSVGIGHSAYDSNEVGGFGNKDAGYILPYYSGRLFKKYLNTGTTTLLIYQVVLAR